MTCTSSSVLVPAIQHVYNMFGNALDAKTGQPLFSKQAWDKANSVLELAHQGYLSDIDSVNKLVLISMAFICGDVFMVQTWLKGDHMLIYIYCKFGALHGEFCKRRKFKQLIS